jgi:hypothetical protein
MNNHALREFLMKWQFWALEAQVAFLVVMTIVEARRLPVRRATFAAGCVVAAGVWLLTATLPPQTNRIYYDEHIYQGVGQNLSDLRRAQMCNDGTVEYGRLQCFQGEYNKEPYGYPHLLSIIYRVTGVSDAPAFRFNNVVAALAALTTMLLADLLFANAWIAVLSGLVLGLLPMQLQWSNTAAAEPAAALLCALTMLAAVHFARVRTTPALVWTVACAAFAMTGRPEGVLVVPLIVLVIALLAPEEFLRRRLWLAAIGGAVVSIAPLLHIVAVQNENWGTTGDRMSWQHAISNFAVNSRFYFWDERFSAWCGAAAMVGVLASGRVRERALLLAYFLAFWTIFLFFYAGSYNYGADVRYSLMAYVPVAILAAVGLWRIAQLATRFARRPWSDGQVFAAIVVCLVVQFLWYVPLVRATGEEAWAARADVRHAKEFVTQLPPNSIVLTHNPAMFHIWRVSAAQMSLIRSNPRQMEQLFTRYAGGVFLHWNYWCNVADPLQKSFCQAGLDGFPHELVASARERDYEYAIYRLQPADRHPSGLLK